jgi:hypothetical protein
MALRSIAEMIDSLYGTTYEERAQLAEAKVDRLEQQLANATKQIVMLRSYLKRWAFTQSEDECAHFEVQEALAATDDLSGYILCDAEPAWYEITARDGTQYALTTTPTLLGHTSEPLYKARNQ